MVSFDPIGLITEGLSQVAIYFIDKDASASIADSKQQQAVYLAEAEANKEDATIYALLVQKAEQQKQNAALLSNQTIKENKKVVYILSLVFIVAFLVLLWVFRLAFKTYKK
jgi:rare lipoprotein A (peptidoglycan hydrolase)